MSGWSTVIHLEGSGFYPSQSLIWTRNSRSLNYTDGQSWTETDELPSEGGASSGQVGYRKFQR